MCFATEKLEQKLKNQEYLNKDIEKKFVMFLYNY